MKSVLLWCPQYSNVLIFSRHATCRVLSMGTHVPTSRLPWYYPVGWCSTRNYLGTRSGTRVACYPVMAALMMMMIIMMVIVMMVMLVKLETRRCRDVPSITWQRARASCTSAKCLLCRYKHNSLSCRHDSSDDCAAVTTITSSSSSSASLSGVALRVA